MEAPKTPKPHKAKAFSPLSLFIFQEAKRIQDEYIKERDLILEESDSKWQKIISELDGISKRLTPEEESYKQLIKDIDSINP